MSEGGTAIPEVLHSDSGRPSWNIIFMGTPAFAVPTLEALVAGPDRVVAVVCQPDRPAGRGRSVQSPPTAQRALEYGIPVLQPTRVRGPDFPASLAVFQPDLIVVVAYGRILTEDVLTLPPYGCINVHASLLPAFRGASPVQWAILSGESTTGITIMQMDSGLDTGPILLQEEVPIAPSMDAGMLLGTLAPVGARLLLQAIEDLKHNTRHPAMQDPHRASYAPLLTKEDGRIVWTLPSHEIDWHVRGMSPWPGAFTWHQGRRLQVLSGSPEHSAHGSPGQVLSTGAEGIRVGTGSGSYLIERLKPESGRPMEASAFVNGRHIEAGDVFMDQLPGVPREAHEA